MTNSAGCILGRYGMILRQSSSDKCDEGNRLFQGWQQMGDLEEFKLKANVAFELVDK